MTEVLLVNHVEVPLLMRRLPREGEDPAIGRARRHLEVQRHHELLLEILSALRKARRARVARPVKA